MRKQTPIVETLPYAASAVRTLALPRVGSIHHLDLRFQLNYTVTNGDPGYDQDFIAKLIGGLAIRDGQGRTWWNCLDGRQLYWLNYLRSQGMARMDAMATGIAAGQLAEALFSIHFGGNPKDPFDPSAGIPAAELSSLALDINWRNAEDLVTTAANFALNSLTVTVTPAERIGPDYAQVRRSMFLPNVRCEKYDIAAAQGEIGIQRALPQKCIVGNTALLVLDADDTRMNVVTDVDQDVTEVGYVKVPENTTPMRQAWQTLRARNLAQFGLPAMTGWEGVALVDWSEISGRASGLDLRRRGDGDDVIGFTTVDTGGDIYLLHTAYAQG